MVHSARGKFESGLYVIGFEVGMFRKNSRVPHAGGQEIENIAYAEAQAPNAWPPPAFARLRRGTRKEVADDLNDSIHARSRKQSAVRAIADFDLGIMQPSRA
jgi:hypothetical protein